MSKNEATITIDCPADQVFNALLDLSRWRAWRPGHIEARQTSPGEPGPGTTIHEVFWLVPPFKGRTTYRITAFEPGRRLEYQSLDGPVHAKFWQLLEPAPGGTRLTIGNETQPSFGLSAFERIFPKMGQRFVEDEAQKLKSVVEGKR